MNKTILFAVVILVIIGGGILLLTNKSTKQQSSSPAQNTINQSLPTDAPKNQTTITVSQSGFGPNTITVKIGTVVTWINKSGSPVTVNSNNHPTHLLYSPLNLGEFNDGSSVQLTFDKPGTYGYHNHLNPSQTGTVIVK
ncbi:MAG: cupredoxin domain-containing protein [Patescibacteria group bacterium]|nr:cupredoxin domain-containing protein [Patescibacteria group bacterium]